MNYREKVLAVYPSAKCTIIKPGVVSVIGLADDSYKFGVGYSPYWEWKDAWEGIQADLEYLLMQ